MIRNGEQTRSRLGRLLTSGLLIFLTLLFPAVVLAEESNRNEVRAGLADGGWSVVYGDLLNEGDYVEFGIAVAEAIVIENPAPIYAFFSSQLQAQVTKIESTAPEIGRQAIEDLLLRAFDGDGSIVRHGRLEISAGLATYKRWERMVYDEPRTYTCYEWGVPYPCITMERVERRVDLPNNFQPYFRFRIAAPPNTGTPGSSTQGSPSYISVTNHCEEDLWFALAYRNALGILEADGYWAIKPHTTQQLITNTINGQGGNPVQIYDPYIYYEAKTSSQSKVWSGDYPFSWFIGANQNLSQSARMRAVNWSKDASGNYNMPFCQPTQPAQQPSSPHQGTIDSQRVACAGTTTRLKIGAVAQVVTDRVNVRRGPGTQNELVYGQSLGNGRTVFIIDGPVCMGGLTWWKGETGTITLSNGEQHNMIGWIAEAVENERFLELIRDSWN